ncbi:hypothetical protein LOK49_LG06G01952 [Camellia lanceoleosa]|uniref:Uncharacterized protein n=1 Tax=Camellia lanceoleosa TaxID=1840588 RepID=A0ACC0HD01_9ERIC|nr:hypothetical protein LOK49_LG06G01952 [Camellia lanceoleosa]
MGCMSSKTVIYVTPRPTQSYGGQPPEPERKSENIDEVGSLEDVPKKMEMSEKNSGWEDLIFIPPGKSQSQHIQEVANA